MSEIERLQPIQHACRRLGVSDQRGYALVREGVLKAPVIVRVGRHIRVNPDALESRITGGGEALPGGWRREDSEARP